MKVSDKLVDDIGLVGQSVLEKLQKKLDLQRSKNLMRTRNVMLNRLSDGFNDGFVDFSSNDYLDISSNPKILSIADDLKSLNQYGSGGSSYVSGYTQEHKLCEDAFANAFGFDRAFLFGNGFMANMGIIKALADKQTLIFSDKLNHASLIDGALASDGKLVRYPHLDLDSLDRLIRKYNSKAGIITSDMVFSMDGDVAYLPKLLEISNKYNYPLILDEAHSAGVLGDNLRLGLVAELNKSQKQNVILVCPLGKSFGAYGAIVLANAVYKDVIEQFARTLIYSTSLPLICAKAARLSLEIILSSEGYELFNDLKSNINYFYKKANLLFGNKMPGINNKSAIQSIIIGDPAKALSLSDHLKKCGFLACAMRSPTVPLGTDRIRITLRSKHTFQQIDGILQAIKNYLGG